MNTLCGRSLQYPLYLLLFGACVTVPCAAASVASANSAVVAPVASASPNPDVTSVVAGNASFGMKLLGLLDSQAPAQNVFISPLSVSTCLAMAMNGAGGQTYSDMSTTLGLDALDLPSVNKAYGSLLPQMAGGDPAVTISVADALWIRPQLTFAPDFQARCREFYGADTSSVDFRSPSAAPAINSWVSQKTQGKIPTLVQPADIAAADAILTNAVYFHGTWTQPFDAKATKDAPFTNSAGAKTMVPMMAQGGQYAYIEDSGSQAICLPYGAGRFGLWVILPKGDLGAWLQKLDAPTLQQIVGAAVPTQVVIHLPRFQATYRTSLKDSLTKLGMGRAFGDKDFNFGPMGLPADFLDDVIHESVITVDEQGTTAAAATGSVMKRSIARRAIVMTVDHPFFCAIRDNVTGELLFVGVIADPQDVPPAS